MVNQLYVTWFRQVRQLWGSAPVPLVRNITWLLVGISLSRSVHLHRIAAQIPGQAKLPSTIRRLARCLQHPQWSVRTAYDPITRSLLRRAAESTGEIRLIIDGSKVSARHQWLLVALAYHHRALPLLWTWLPYERGHSSVQRQLRLLRSLYLLMPAGIPVLLVGDTEFGTVKVLRQLEAWHWQYVLRQKGYTQIRLPGQRFRQAFRSWVRPRGVQVWAVQAALTKRYAFRTNVVGYWQMSAKEPWLLATNLPSAAAALRAYRRRMWIEELFGDLKKQGFDLERTRLRHQARLSRLTMLVALLYLWFVLVGQQGIQNGQRHWVDRRDRRDLSLFQIGWRLIERWLTNQQAFTVRLTASLN